MLAQVAVPDRALNEATSTTKVNFKSRLLGHMGHLIQYLSLEATSLGLAYARINCSCKLEPRCLLK